MKKALSMHFNTGVIVPIIPLMPQGTNSTMFTACCNVAICNDQLDCPYCGRLVIGYDAISPSKRERVRWQNATQHWNR